MFITNNLSNTNFNGIKLSNNNYEFVKKIATSLIFKDVNVVGKKTIYVDNNFNSKQKLFKIIRNENNFSGSECGFVFLPWSQECWIIANCKYEQVLIDKIKQMDSGAQINISI